MYHFVKFILYRFYWFVFTFTGIEAQLYYVREGVVNDYALNFVVMIPADISDLQFTWQSLTKHPVRFTY